MRGYQCYVHHLRNGVMEQNGNTACFAGLTGYYIPNAKDQEVNMVYITQIRTKETEKYLELLIRTINKITLCELVTINKQKYIKFQLLPSYDQSLVLLNFIRNLWCNPIQYGIKTVSIPYHKTFFEVLARSRRTDPLIKLTLANKKACELANFRGSLGHSNCHEYNRLKLKKTEELMNYKGNSTYIFLTT